MWKPNFLFMTTEVWREVEPLLLLWLHLPTLSLWFSCCSLSIPKHVLIHPVFMPGMFFLQGIHLCSLISGVCSGVTSSESSFLSALYEMAASLTFCLQPSLFPLCTDHHPMYLSVHDQFLPHENVSSGRGGASCGGTVVAPEPRTVASL